MIRSTDDSSTNCQYSYLTTGSNCLTCSDGYVLVSNGICETTPASACSNLFECESCSNNVCSTCLAGYTLVENS